MRKTARRTHRRACRCGAPARIDVRKQAEERELQKLKAEKVRIERLKAEVADVVEVLPLSAQWIFGEIALRARDKLREATRPDLEFGAGPFASEKRKFSSILRNLEDLKLLYRGSIDGGVVYRLEERFKLPPVVDEIIMRTAVTRNMRGARADGWNGREPPAIASPSSNPLDGCHRGGTSPAASHRGESTTAEVALENAYESGMEYAVFRLHVKRIITSEFDIERGSVEYTQMRKDAKRWFQEHASDTE